MVCCEKKACSCFSLGLGATKVICFFLLLGLHFFVSITCIHQTSNIVVNLSPACLAFWIQNFVLDHCVHERGFLFGYVKAGL